MTNKRQWIEETLAHRETSRVPYNFMFSPVPQQKLEEYFRTDCLDDAIDNPIRMSGPNGRKPLYADPDEFGETIEDVFGVTWNTSKIDRGSPIGPCLKEPSLVDYTFPDPSVPFRFEDLDKWCENNSKHFRVLWVGDLWERATFMRGMEDILIDLMIAPDFVDELLGGLADYILTTMEILFQRFEFECIAVSDDYGTQTNTIISPESWRKHIRPVLQEIYSFAKQHNRKVFHHSCGNNYPIIGDMIDIGLDILHPIQPETMDILQLKKEFGRDLTFCGGLGTQEILPHGTEQQVRDEVKRLKELMGRGGGYILEPGITIQADVPLANLLAMIDEARLPS